MKHYWPSLLWPIVFLGMLVIPPTLTAQAPPKQAVPPTLAQSGKGSPGAKQEMLEFPDGTATPSELCGACHQAIYREHAEGFGADLQYGEILYESPGGKRVMGMPAKTSLPTLHAVAGTEPFPIHARTVEEAGKSCNVCRFPQAFEIPEMNRAEIAKPTPRPKAEEAGRLTCASCHALGARVVGKQTQTFLEWREDFSKPRLGRQHCQDCHMPKTQRKMARTSTCRFARWPGTSGRAATRRSGSAPRSAW